MRNQLPLRAVTAAAFAVTFLASAQPSCDPPAAGLQAWWPGEGNAMDLVHQNNGSSNGTVTYVTGEVGQAFLFNGSSSILISNSPSVNLSIMTNWTIEAWINPASYNNEGYPTIFGQGHWRASLGLDSSSGQLENWINNSAVIDSTGTVPLNQWSHVALVFTPTNRTFYINGAASGSFAAAAVVAVTENSAIGGMGDSSGDGYFDGAIDEVTIYNSALSAGQIAAIYTAGTTGKCQNGLPPYIQTGPTNEIVNLGGTISQSVTPGGPGPFFYQWLFNAAPLTNATNATLTITPAAYTNGGFYSVVVSNLNAALTSSVAIVAVPVPGAGTNVAVYTGYYDEPPSTGVPYNLPLPVPWYGSSNTTWYGGNTSPVGDPDVSVVMLQNLGPSIVVLTNASIGGTYDLFALNSITNPILLVPYQFSVLVGPDGSESSFIDDVIVALNGTSYTNNDVTNALLYPNGVLHGYPNAADETVPWTPIYTPAALALTPPVLTSATLGTNLTLFASNGVAGRSYTVLATNPLSALPPQVYPIASEVINVNNKFSIAAPAPSPAATNQFYILQAR